MTTTGAPSPKVETDPVTALPPGSEKLNSTFGANTRVSNRRTLSGPGSTSMYSALIQDVGQTCPLQTPPNSGR